jgi:hypothetical protein
MVFVIPSEVEESRGAAGWYVLRDVSTALDTTNALDGASFFKRFVGAVFVDCLQTTRRNANAYKLL